jgi:serine/threonine protein kinase
MLEQVSSYRLEDEIARGGMGIVYRGVHTVFDQVVAIKAIFPELTLNPELRERFMNEAKIQYKLQHPNIVQLREFLIEQGKFYIVMEYIEGETLGQSLRHLGRPMAECEAIPIFCQALEGLGFAHSHGVIHRDIKPSNIMLTREGVAKLTDFGIARALGGAKLTRTGTALGTPAYMSPEQIEGTKLDQRTDIYSMGIMLYEMLTGRLPFERAKDSDSDFPVLAAHISQPPLPPSSWVPEISPIFEGAILQALAKKPEDRFASCEEFSAALALPELGPTKVVVMPAPPPEVHPSRNYTSTPRLSTGAFLDSPAAQTAAVQPAVQYPVSEPVPANLPTPAPGRVVRAVRAITGSIHPRFSLLSGGVLVLLTLFLPVAYQSCGPSRTGLAFVRGESGDLPIMGLLGGGRLSRGFYILTLMLAVVAVTIVLLSALQPAVLRSRRSITVLFGISGSISLILFSNAAYEALVYGAVLFTPKAFGAVTSVVIPGAGLLAAGLALSSRSLRKSKVALVLLALGGVSCLLMLTDFVVSLSLPGGYLPKTAGSVITACLVDLYWLVPVCLWFQFSLFKKPGAEAEWLSVRSGIVKAYLPCVVGVPGFLWLAVAAGHVWGFIPYTLGIHLMSLGYMQLSKQPWEQGVQSFVSWKSTA